MIAESLELIKSEFTHLDTLYFNTAYFGPSPYRAKQRVMQALQKELNPSFYDYDVWMGIGDRIREKIAQVLNCKSTHIAHQTSVSDINTLVATGLNLAKDDVICAIDQDYPSDILPWMMSEKLGKGVFHLMKSPTTAVDPDWVIQNLPAKTKVFCVSHVAFDTGKKIDVGVLGKKLKEKGIFFIVDTTQALGGLAITKEELDCIDVLACSSYKWMLGPYGHAFAYFSERALSSIQYTQANWIKAPTSTNPNNLTNYTLDTFPGACKFDRGQVGNMLAMACLDASLDLFIELGLESIELYNRKLRDFFLDNFPKKKYSLLIPKESLGNIVSLKAQKTDSIEIKRILKHNNTDVSVREGNIRLSFHLFNTKDQIKSLIRALDQA